MAEAASRGRRFTLDAAELPSLLSALQADGYGIIGPTRADGAIRLQEIRRVEDLPRGWREEQAPGGYRLMQSESPAYFPHHAGPQSWKRFLFPPESLLWSAVRNNGGFTIQAPAEEAPRLALLGIRPCDVHAIAIQDRVFLGGPHIDTGYARRRRSVFIAAVNCSSAGASCFCASMDSGPRARKGFDIAMTEVVEDGLHCFVIESGSREGAELLTTLPVRRSTEEETQAAERALEAAVAGLGRSVDTRGLKEALASAAEHPRWEEIGRKCMNCGSCTLACPTCFCSTVVDSTDVGGRVAERRRIWDSCFTMDFSLIHGGSVRYSAAARYRQWLTHKFSTWVDQFDRFGCVGCGRCITWCPVGIDVTEELQRIAGASKAAHSSAAREA